MTCLGPRDRVRNNLPEAPQDPLHPPRPQQEKVTQACNSQASAWQ